jgi:hypothetical protein
MWWAGLSAADAVAAMGVAAPQLASARVDGQTYYFAPDLPDAPDASGEAFLLPPFDEFLIGYRDRGASITAAGMARVAPGRNGLFFPIVVLDGRVVGTWRRDLKARSVKLSFTPFDAWGAGQARAVAAAAEAYAAFLGSELILADL